jgi:predicted nucleic acid-binding protein
MITFVEVLTGAIREDDVELVDQYTDVFLGTEGFTIYELSHEIAQRAASLRVLYGLRTPDAIIVSSAFEAECDAIITNDESWKRIQEIEVLYLGDFLNGGKQN